MATATMHRSAWGLTADRDIAWRERAACTGMWHEFTTFAQGPGLEGRAARAAHICWSHCPVRAYCRLATDRHRPIEQVQAGLLWRSYAKQKPVELPDPGCGPWCAHLREGR